MLRRAVAAEPDLGAWVLLVLAEKLRVAVERLLRADRDATETR